LTEKGARPREAFVESRVKGRLLVIAAAALWSTSGLFAKSPFFDDWPLEIRGPLLAFWRAAFAGLVLLPMSRERRWSWWIGPMVLCFAAMNFTYLKSMTLTNAANAIWLQSTAPLWVFLLGALFFQEQVRRLDWITLVFVAAGVGLILIMEIRAQQKSGDGHSLPGVLYGLGSGLLLACVYLFLRRLRTFDSWWLVGINLAMTGALFAPYVAWQGVWPTSGQFAVLACFGAFQMGLPYVLFARGLRHIPSYEGSGLALFEPLLVPLWVFLAWGHLATYEPPRWWTFAGGGLILAGLALRYGAEALRRPVRPAIAEKITE
jgi:drug/metabolite transporter (DMT)-like permease